MQSNDEFKQSFNLVSNVHFHQQHKHSFHDDEYSLIVVFPVHRSIFPLQEQKKKFFAINSFGNNVDVVGGEDEGEKLARQLNIFDAVLSPNISERWRRFFCMFSSCLLSHLHVLREGKVFDDVSSSFPLNYEISLKLASFFKSFWL
jgi:hypothetical protein